VQTGGIASGSQKRSAPQGWSSGLPQGVPAASPTTQELSPRAGSNQQTWEAHWSPNEHCSPSPSGSAAQTRGVSKLQKTDSQSKSKSHWSPSASGRVRQNPATHSSDSHWPKLVHAEPSGRSAAHTYSQ
jgi:hypothetical protein